MTSIHISVSKTIDAPHDDVWNVIGDFSSKDAVSKVFELPPDSLTFGGGDNVVGAFRVITAFGPVAKESLVSYDGTKMEYKYAMSDFGPLPVDSYTARWAVLRDGCSSRVTVDVDIKALVPDTGDMPKEGQPAAATCKGLETMVTSFYHRHLKNLDAIVSEKQVCTCANH